MRIGGGTHGAEAGEARARKEDPPSLSSVFRRTARTRDRVRTSRYQRTPLVPLTLQQACHPLQGAGVPVLVRLHLSSLHIASLLSSPSFSSPSLHPLSAQPFPIARLLLPSTTALARCRPSKSPHLPRSPISPSQPSPTLLAFTLTTRDGPFRTVVHSPVPRRHWTNSPVSRLRPKRGMRRKGRHRAEGRECGFGSFSPLSALRASCRRSI